MDLIQNGALADSPKAVEPTRVRWNILALMLVVSMVTYLDRLNISIAAPQIMDSFRLSRSEMGRVFSAFVLAYGLFQVPSGWLADRYGPRRVIFLALLWWSALTATTAVIGKVLPPSIVPTVIALAAARFFLGMGEAAAWPSFNRAVANWVPSSERALAASVPLAGGGLGATLTPPLIAWLMVSYGWRSPFYVSALIGVAVAVAWYWYVRDTPEEHSAVNREEMHLIRGSLDPVDTRNLLGTATPWRLILREPNVWLLFLTNLSAGYVIYIYLTWFYIYLVEARHLTMVKSSVYTMAPFLAITVMTPLGGYFGDLAAKRYTRAFARRLIAMTGMGFAAIALFLGARLPNLNQSIFAFAIGAGGVFFALSAHWATTIDVSKRHAGTVSGIMNWGGNTGGMISPMLTPYLAKTLGWAAALEIAAAIMMIGSLLWFFIKPDRALITQYAGAERQ